MSTLAKATVKKPVAKKYAFRVYDSDDLWGDIRMSATSEEKAKKLCEKWLRDNEVEPHGLLLPDFTLVALKDKA